MSNVWRIVRIVWYDGSAMVVGHPRLRDTLLHSSMESAIRGSSTKAFVVAEEPGAGSEHWAWGKIEKPYHVIVFHSVWGSGHTELACYDDLDVAEMALRMWMAGQ